MAGGEASVGVFVEPAFRLRTQRGPFELTAQAGLSLPTGDAYQERFSHVPFTGGVGVAYRLRGFGR